jgi:hypothetical protein
MATRVYNEETITLQDDTEVTLRPLPIAPLRRFMDAWDGFQETETAQEGFDVFVNCAGIALESNFKKLGKFDSLKPTAEEKKEGLHISGEYKEYLDEVLDLDTIYKVLEVCGGIKLQFDPKVMDSARQAVETLESLGES